MCLFKKKKKYDEGVVDICSCQIQLYLFLPVLENAA